MRALLAGTCLAAAAMGCGALLLSTENIEGNPRPEAGPVPSDAPSDAPNELGCDGDGGGALLAYFPLDEGQGLVAHDCSERRLVGELAPGVSWTAGRFGGAVRIDESYIQIANAAALQLTTTFSVSAWVNYDRGQTDKRLTVVAKMGPDNQRGWELRIEGDVNQAVFTASTDGVIERNAVGDVQPGTWTHLAGVFDKSALFLYVDGELTERQVLDAAEIHNEPTIPVRIGSRSYLPRFHGVVDEVRIFARALDVGEIRALAGR